MPGESDFLWDWPIVYSGYNGKRVCQSIILTHSLSFISDCYFSFVSFPKITSDIAAIVAIPANTNQI